ncbi:MAG: 4-hydroxy-tetrahydrodipicolinate reductase [Haliscomenobacter sp.]|jgi:4-hydroxy-tetrahydrodipicolinate reductase|nr:4-hydroxy-tetrahydrodipicolinate reductase [Haliscomenobacter sp.]
MKIALIGYGKMGKIIAKLAEEAGHTIALVIDRDNLDELTSGRLAEAEVAIEFSQPESAVGNIIACLEAGLPVVCGTTGWLDHLDEVKAQVASCQGALFYASNYSIGVNLFFAINRYLARLMNGQPQYDVALEEIHHTQKLDAPSGTAITLANSIVEEIDRKQTWVAQVPPAPGEIPIHSIRLGETPGTHQIVYTSPVDSIVIRHEANSREGFAKGALEAAQWLVGKQGVFGMEDMLGLAI